MREKNFKTGRKTRVPFPLFRNKNTQREERSLDCLHSLNTDKAIIFMLHDSERSVLHFGGFGGDGIECEMQAKGVQNKRTWSFRKTVSCSWQPVVAEFLFMKLNCCQISRCAKNSFPQSFIWHEAGKVFMIHKSLLLCWRFEKNLNF